MQQSESTEIMETSAETEEVCEYAPAEMERMARKGMRSREGAGVVRDRHGGIAGTLACEIHMGSLYYREFPFGGYCEEAPVARIFPGQE